AVDVLPITLARWCGHPDVGRVAVAVGEDRAFPVCAMSFAGHQSGTRGAARAADSAARPYRSAGAPRTAGPTPVGRRAHTKKPPGDAETHRRTPDGCTQQVRTACARHAACGQAWRLPHPGFGLCGPLTAPPRALTRRYAI